MKRDESLMTQWVASFPGRSHLQYLIAYSIWSCTV